MNDNVVHLTLAGGQPWRVPVEQMVSWSPVIIKGLYPLTAKATVVLINGMTIAVHNDIEEIERLYNVAKKA